MKLIQADRDTLLKPLQTVTGIVERRHTLPILSNVFIELKNVYPPATLHDCVDGNDENRVLLNQTIISNINSQP